MQGCFCFHCITLSFTSPFTPQTVLNMDVVFAMSPRNFSRAIVNLSVVPLSITVFGLDSVKFPANQAVGKVTEHGWSTDASGVLLVQLMAHLVIVFVWYLQKKFSGRHQHHKHHTLNLMWFWNPSMTGWLSYVKIHREAKTWFCNQLKMFVSAL